MTDKYFGKCKGVVVDNEDPLDLGRLSVNVPDVYGPIPAWAMPCVSYSKGGLEELILPPPGTNIWVEFESGDIDYPIWTGVFFGSP